MTSTERVDLERAFVLYGRPWRETSELLEVFTHDHGRLSLVARGMRRPKAGLRGILQPFRPLMLSWAGRGGGLMTLRAAESYGSPVELHGTPLMSGFYVNELVLRFLHRGDPHPRLFTAYEHTLGRLAGAASQEAVLRGFELELLAEVGYGLNLDHDASTGERLDPPSAYRYVIERGPVPADANAGSDQAFSGSELLAIARGDFSDPRHLQGARRLLRAVLDHYLAGKPLRTREVFSAMKR